MHKLASLAFALTFAACSHSGGGGGGSSAPPASVTGNWSGTFTNYTGIQWASTAAFDQHQDGTITGFVDTSVFGTVTAAADDLYLTSPTTFEGKLQNGAGAHIVVEWTVAPLTLTGTWQKSASIQHGTFNLARTASLIAPPPTEPPAPHLRLRRFESPGVRVDLYSVER